MEAELDLKLSRVDEVIDLLGIEENKAVLRSLPREAVELMHEPILPGDVGRSDRRSRLMALVGSIQASRLKVFQTEDRVVVQTMPSVKADCELPDVMVGNAAANPMCEFKQVGKVSQIIINRERIDKIGK